MTYTNFVFQTVEKAQVATVLTGCSYSVALSLDSFFLAIQSLLNISSVSILFFSNNLAFLPINILSTCHMKYFRYVVQENGYKEKEIKEAMKEKEKAKEQQEESRGVLPFQTYLELCHSSPEWQNNMDSGLQITQTKR